MLQTSHRAERETGSVSAAPSASVAAAIAERLAQGNLVYVALDDRRATDIASIAAALVPDAVVVQLPSSDALPGDEAPASPANVGLRVAALRRVRAAITREIGPVLLVTTAEATAVRYPEPALFDAAPPRLSVGDTLDVAAFAATAAEIGYIVDDRIDEPGEIAVRGNVIDIFPADRETPVRIEFAEGRITALRDYDPVSQLGSADIACIEVGRATEPPVDKPPVYKGVGILAHLPDAAVAFDPGVDRRRARFIDLAADGLPRRKASADLVTTRSWDAAIARRGGATLTSSDTPSPRFVEYRDPARAFAKFARDVLADSRLVLVGSPRDLRFLQPRLERRAKIAFTAIERWSDVTAALPGTAMMLVAPIDRGFAAPGVTVVAGADLLGGRARGDELGGAGAGALPGLSSELRCGDVVVHEEFGIGIVRGLERLPDTGGDTDTDTGGDAIILCYAKDGRRLVPVAEADRIWRYGADADAVTLDALDGTSWQKRRGAIDAAIAESARDLAAIAAERAALTTDPIVADRAAYERFAGGFAFTETPDQARAIASTLADLASGRPMDRLVIGDVGYGKTEIALRAAGMVALAGRQVAIAAPTTVLVRQHIETFKRRFAGTGIAVAGLSRLSSAAEKSRVRAGLADGSIGVVIGTGAIAGKGVAYKDLALVVIDEEQRFGVADKAKLHALGAGHVLTLSATPIPRTLQSAMIGLQGMSVIATPPARRQPIRTAVAAFDDMTVRAALRRERARGGQSFVVVPRIDDMAPLAARLAKLVPELGIVQAHGKMSPTEIDEAMVGFAAGDGDVLLATNIIEAGLDVPRANTMIVHHADRFGLSQLHQLRGRVGRGGRRGQVMLLTDGDATIAEATLKRLRTLQAFDRLGAGFAISARDLDLRGAGDLVGEAQAGHMKLIGIDLYQHLFGRALRLARGEAVDDWVPELHLDVGGRLPETWIPEEEVRLSLYSRLARLEDVAALDQFEAELEDRFGRVPDPAHRLLLLARIRLRACAAGIRRIDAGPAAIAFTPNRRGAEPPLAELVEKNGRWIAPRAVADPVERAAQVEALLDALTE
ncbi:TRCF domain-containing protein [Sphingomonas faeni]|uniref:TRCF domain-containing protein n=1 Tax=Sphingomonas faeni TaxID=185950 RepID=UPI0020BF6730|nr:TRCF domain-containing protein [Sphingomonas faeni]MCK8457326.1 DEAD/DEAH box helicase [Sphingomonas faeni]